MAHEALELPHQPSPERLIDISQEWAQSRTRVPSVVSDPTPKEWIELTGEVPSQEWLEIDGGVISALFNKANRR